MRHGGLVRLYEAARRPPCWRCAPTLLEPERAPPPDEEDLNLLEDVEPLPFQAQCGLALVVISQGEGWAETWRVDRADHDKLKSDMFCEIDGSVQKDGNISWEDFEVYCEKHKEEILQGPSVFHGMLHESSRYKAFEKFDGDGHVGLSRAEFDQFLCSLEDQHMEYLMRRAHAQFRAFWGRRAGAMEAEARHERGLEMVREVVDASALQEVDGSAEPMRRLLLGRDGDITLAPGGGCLGLFAPGWWEDLMYYSANNHPLHGIFMCDSKHSLDWKERLMMELSTLCYTWFILHEARHLEDAAGAVTWGAQSKFLFVLLFTTIPGMVWWYSLFMLFTAPCANIDESAESALKVAKMKSTRRMCEAIGHIFVLSSTMMLLWSLWERTDYFAWPVLLGRVKGYAISWILMLFLYFNPLVAFGNSDPAQPPSLIDKLADIIGIGQWRIEKLRFQYLCIRGLEEMESQSEPGVTEIRVEFARRGCFCGVRR